MKKILYIFLTSLILVLMVGCYDIEYTNILANEVTIADENEFIDIDDNVIKFLFKTEKGNSVRLYLGEEIGKLELRKEVDAYNNEGVRLDEFSPGKVYYYKIEAINGNKKAVSDINSVTKIGNTNNWERAKWPKNKIFYEIFVRSFYDGNGDGIGDFAGLKEKIPYLKDLGVDALWLMPITESNTYHGYDVVDYYDTEDDYGTIEEFKDLLETAHANDIKVIMDLVVNHSSSYNEWFVKSQELESKYRDYYVWKDKFDSDGGPWHRSPSGYYYGVFWDQMPDLNLRNPEVRADIKGVAEFWLELGVDGFRLDAAKHIDDFDPEVTHNWWQEFNSFVKSINPDAFLVGENWDYDIDIIGQYFQDLDSSFNFSLADDIINFASGEDVDIIDNLNKIHDIYGEYSSDFIDCIFMRNHDQNRVAYELDDKGQLKLAASILFTLPGTPFIYFGEEIGQVGSKPDDNIREPFDWYQEAQGEGMTTMAKGGFYNPMRFTEANDGISLEEQKDVEGSIYEHYKKLIEIRKSHETFITGEYKKIDSLANTYSYQISDKVSDYKLMVIHNPENISKSLFLNGEAEELLSGMFLDDELIYLESYGTVILKYYEDLELN